MSVLLSSDGVQGDEALGMIKIRLKLRIHTVFLIVLVLQV